jgi:flagellar motor switch/type III secretory pathway protein FliN
MAEKTKAAAKQASTPAPRHRDTQVTVTMELGRTRCTLDQLLQFGENSLFDLDKAVGEPIEHPAQR